MDSLELFGHASRKTKKKGGYDIKPFVAASKENKKKKKGGF